MFRRYPLFHLRRNFNTKAYSPSVRSGFGSGRETLQRLTHDIVNFPVKVPQSLLGITNLLRGQRRPNRLSGASVRYGELHLGQNGSPRIERKAGDIAGFIKGAKHWSDDYVGSRRGVGPGETARFILDAEVGMILIKDETLRLQLAVERFNQNLVNVGFVLRALMGDEIIFSDGVTFVPSEIVRSVVVGGYLLGKDGRRGHEERHRAECQVLTAFPHGSHYSYFLTSRSSSLTR